MEIPSCFFSPGLPFPPPLAKHSCNEHPLGEVGTGGRRNELFPLPPPPHRSLASFRNEPLPKLRCDQALKTNDSEKVSKYRTSFCPYQKCQGWRELAALSRQNSPKVSEIQTFRPSAKIATGAKKNLSCFEDEQVLTRLYALLSFSLVGWGKAVDLYAKNVIRLSSQMRRRSGVGVAKEEPGEGSRFLLGSERASEAEMAKVDSAYLELGRREGQGPPRDKIAACVTSAMGKTKYDPNMAAKKNKKNPRMLRSFSVAHHKYINISNHVVVEKMAILL